MREVNYVCVGSAPHGEGVLHWYLGITLHYSIAELAFFIISMSALYEGRHPT